MFYLMTFLVVYYNAQEPQYDVYTYDNEEFEIEVTCAEGVTDCKDTEESRDKREETRVSRPYGSYYQREIPYVFIY